MLDKNLKQGFELVLMDELFQEDLSERIMGEEFFESNQLISTRAESARFVEAELDTPDQSKPNILDNFKLNQAFRLAKKKVKEGDTEEAKRIYKDILAKFPKNKHAQQYLVTFNRPQQTPANQIPLQDAINDLTNLYNQGQLSAVVEYAQLLTHSYPNAFIAWNLLGAAAAQIGQLEKAIIAFQRVIIIEPNFADAYYNMGNTLKDLGKLEEAIEAYNKALAIKPNFADAYYNMGNILKGQGELEKSIVSYEKALSLKPDYADAYNNMGNALQDQGKLEEAIASYKKVLSLKPDYAEAHRHLSSFIRYKSDDPQVVLISEMIQQSNLKDYDRCNLNYTFAKMKEDLGDLDAAYDNYVAGGKLRQKLMSYEFKQDELKFDQIKNTAPELKEFAFDKPIQAATNTPIFILGMPRSGTTLVEQIISSHSQVHGAGELPFLARFGDPLILGTQKIDSDNLLQIRKAYLDELKKISNGCQFVTDKMPSNFQSIALIFKALSEAKVIHVKRDPSATCWSNFKHYFSEKGLGYSYDLKDTVNYFKLYQELMDFWDRQYKDQIYHLDYDKLTLEQELETKKLIKYLELDWEDTCLLPEENSRIVRTASQQQVRKKVYTGSSQKWRKFEPYINGMFDELSVT